MLFVALACYFERHETENEPCHHHGKQRNTNSDDSLNDAMCDTLANDTKTTIHKNA